MTPLVACIVGVCVGWFVSLVLAGAILNWRGRKKRLWMVTEYTGPGWIIVIRTNGCGFPNSGEITVNGVPPTHVRKYTEVQ